MKDLNTVHLTGRLTRDPEIRYVQNGDPVANFDLAVNRGKRDDGEEIPAFFFSVEAWGKLAEIVQEYFKKGAPVVLQGGLIVNSWKNDAGENRHKVKIRAHYLRLQSGQPHVASEVEGQKDPQGRLGE